jgi:hypothetical protein
MWEPQPPATLRASTACTGITLLFYLTKYYQDYEIKKGEMSGAYITHGAEKKFIKFLV